MRRRRVWAHGPAPCATLLSVAGFGLLLVSFSPVSDINARNTHPADRLDGTLNPSSPVSLLARMGCLHRAGRLPVLMDPGYHQAGSRMRAASINQEC